VALKVNLSFKNRFPYISVIDEASYFKFGMQLEFDKLPEIWGFFFNISTQLRFDKAHHKIRPTGKVGVALS